MHDTAPLHATPAWRKAIGEHDAAVTAFLGAVDSIPEAEWHVPSAPGKWTAAEEVLHVVLAYEVALRGVRAGAGMRLRVSPSRARLLRWLVLPVMLDTGWFPRAKAPAEIRPEADAPTNGGALHPAPLRSRLVERAREVRVELPASAPHARFHHAYFGELAPRTAMRMLAAHTRHHARLLGRKFRKVME